MEFFVGSLCMTMLSYNKLSPAFLYHRIFICDIKNKNTLGQMNDKISFFLMSQDSAKSIKV